MSVRVLLVDEDIDELATLAAELRSRGVQVALANGISMACERAKTARVDVVLASSELAVEREGITLLDALAIELGQLPPVLLLVAEMPLDAKGEYVLRRDPEAIVARVHQLSVPSRGRPSEVPMSALYSGSLAKVGLTDVIETLWVDRKTGTLAVSTAQGAGDVRLVDGEIADAVYLRFEGPKALVRMIAEGDGRFLFSPETPAIVRRMHVATADLLEWAEREIQESKRLRAQLGDLANKALLAAEGDQTAMSPLARTVLAKLRAPATLDDVLDDLAESDGAILAAVVELEGANKLRRLAHEATRVPLVAADQLHLMRALVSRASMPGYEGAARLIFAGTPSRLAVFAHAAMCLADAIATSEPAPPIPIPHPIATVRLGDDVDLELIALPLVPAYAPLWPMALAGSAIVVRLDDAAGSALTEACAAAELPVLDAQVLVGALEEASVAQVASLVRAAIEATQGA